MIAPWSTLLLALIAVAQADPTTPMRGDLARLQGTWRAELGPDRTRPVVMTIQGASCRLKTTDTEGQPITITATLKLDEAARPRTWDSVRRAQADGRSMPDLAAIYELDGDTLRLCNNGPGKPRPTQFPTEDQGLPVVIVFQRLKDQGPGD